MDALQTNPVDMIRISNGTYRIIFAGIAAATVWTLSVACQNREPVQHEGYSLAELQRLALDSGDTQAYNALNRDYMEAPYDGFLSVALIMANKHRYPQAFLDVYYCLTDVVHKTPGTELDHLDTRTRLMALEYLESGAELGDKECMEYLGRHYLIGKHVSKDEAKGNALIKRSEE